METAKEQLKRFEQLQKELIVLSYLGSVDPAEASRIFEELKQFDKPRLRLIIGGKQ